MDTKHVVKANETITSIAANYNILDPLKIWEYGKNEALKTLRKKPNLLREGDQIYIPELEQREEGGEAEKKHNFTVKKAKAKLILVLLDNEHNPLANMDFVLTIPGIDPISKKTDGGGKIEEEIGPSVTSAKLVYDGNEVDLNIGGLDPIDTIKGFKQRLLNIGYKTGEVNNDETEEFKLALAKFTAEYLPGKPSELNEQTQKKLEEVYGC